MSDSLTSVKYKRRFLGKTTAFLALLVISGVLVNAAFIRLVLSHSYLYRTEAQFQEYKQTARLLVVGDSHPMSAVDTRVIPNSFSLTSSGENIVETYYRLKYYLEEEPLDISLVLLPADLHTYSSFRLDRYEAPDYWRKYIDYNEFGTFKGERWKYLRERLSGEFAYTNGITSTINYLNIRMGLSDGRDPLIRGYRLKQSRFIDQENPPAMARQRVDVHLSGHELITADFEAYLVRILALLEKHRVKAVFIRYPVSLEYYQYAGQAVDINAFYETLGAILQGRSQVYPILDYHDLFWDHEQYFDDSDHLNEAGAREFTICLKEELEALGYLP